MSVDTEEVETIPMTGSVEVGGDIDAAVEEEHALAKAEGEGLPPVPEKSTLEELRQAEATAARSRLMSRLYESIDEVDAAKSHVLATGEEHKDAKKAMEAAMAFHLHLTKQIRGLDNASKPDPKAYPLLDGKAEIDATFAKPEAIAPLPPDNPEEYLRRKQESTLLADMGLKPATVKVLEGLELTTAGKIKRHFDGVPNGWMKPGAVKGMTDARLNELADAFVEIADAAKVEWEGIGLEEAIAADEDTF